MVFIETTTLGADQRFLKFLLNYMVRANKSNTEVWPNLIWGQEIRAEIKQRLMMLLKGGKISEAEFKGTLQ